MFAVHIAGPARIKVFFKLPKPATRSKSRPPLTLERKILKCKKPVIDRLFCGGGGEIRTHDISLAKRALSH
jgi:hypothetical protein